MSNISIRDLEESKSLKKQAMATIVGGRIVQGVVGNLDGNPVFISDWQLFTLQMEGKVTYK